MASWNGTELFYRAWLPPASADKALILFHRGHEHSGRWQDFVDAIDLPDIAIFAWDARGHGRSPGARGDAESFGCLVKDVDAFVRHISTHHGIAMENIAVVANSVGSVLVSSWVHDYAPPLRALVLGSPALRVRLYVPFAVPLLRLVSRVWKRASLRSYVKGRLLSRDPAKIAQYDDDPLITPTISVRVLLGMHDAATRLMADAGAITTPLLMLTAGADWVVDRKSQTRFFEGVSSPHKAMKILPGFLHDIFNERDNQVPIGLARDFLRDAFAREPAGPGERAAPAAAFTRTEFDHLSRPLPRLAPRRIAFGSLRVLMATIGRLSQGVRTGWQQGFDSGAMLDYVYQNRARGTAGLGRLIDRSYLDSIGWRGIRQRGASLESMIGRTIEAVHTEGRPVRLLDIAAGHGRYLLNSLTRKGQIDATALLRDDSAQNVAAGRAEAERLGLSGVTWETGDAFDRGSFAAIRPCPTIAIVSGLYELFPDNGMIDASLAGLHEVLEDGGYLIYTNQPWHPQIEMIVRVLPSHRDGKPWIMRRRAQVEMDALVQQAGFEKLAMAIDDFGIFTVSLARRRSGGG